MLCSTKFVQGCSGHKKIKKNGYMKYCVMFPVAKVSGVGLS